MACPPAVFDTLPGQGAACLAALPPARAASAPALAGPASRFDPVRFFIRSSAAFGELKPSSAAIS
ncbi:hypothetical protein, partial [Burkholderia gladioli]|uniref:hypothetical protein n=1 Tax=Burkholderia gladioli TaxID=28095 RepID=UPI000D4B72EC